MVTLKKMDDKEQKISGNAGAVCYPATARIVIAALMLSAVSFTAMAQTDFCNSKNISYQNGERLTFHAYYNMGFIWIYAGNCIFTTTATEYNGRKAYYIAGDGRTAKSYEWFYKVRDLYETYIDQETLLPLRFIRNVSEGSLKYKHDAAFNRTAQQVTDNGRTFSITQCTQDVLSAVYYARNIDYSKYNPGDRIPFDMFLDDKVYPLYIKYMGKERIDTKFGVFNAIKIVPLLIEGTIFDGGEKMTVWVSDDKNHIPLRVSSPVVIGSVKADLMQYEHLRNPFTSLIKLH